MGSFFSPRWWVQTFISVFITMIFIYFIKKLSNQFNVPFVKDVANEV